MEKPGETKVHVFYIFCLIGPHIAFTDIWPLPEGGVPASRNPEKNSYGLEERSMPGSDLTAIRGGNLCTALAAIMTKCVANMESFCINMGNPCR